MGWQDAPVVEDEAASGAPSWMSAPEIDDQPNYGLREDGTPTGPDDEQIAVPNHEAPGMGKVILNAIPKGVANLANTPHTINSLIIRGLAALPGLDSVPQVKNFLQGIADHPQMSRNMPMELMEHIGAVNPENEPQTGPQRVVDMAIQNAVQSAIVPGSGVIAAGKSALMGAASGAAAQATKEGTGSNLLAIAVGMAVPSAGMAKDLAQASFRAVKPAPQSPLNNATRMKTLEDAQAIGLKVQPSSVKSGAAVNTLESVAGPGKLDIALTLQNQRAATQAAKEALGLPSDAELTVPLLNELRKTASQPYRDIAAISPKAARALDNLKQARFEASEHYTYYYKSGNPDAGKAARTWQAKADALERVIDDEAKKIIDVYGVKRGQSQPSSTQSNLKQIGTTAVSPNTPTLRDAPLEFEKVATTTAGDPNILERLRSARQLIARSYDVQNALNRGDGHVNMHVFGKMLAEDRPLSGGLAVMGRFANAFEKVSRPGSSVGTTTSGTDAASAAVLGASSGSILAGGIPLLRGPARKKLLADEIQQYLTKDRPMPQMKLPLTRSLLTGKTMIDNEKEKTQ